jgi:hypothetical protein
MTFEEQAASLSADAADALELAQPYWERFADYTANPNVMLWHILPIPPQPIWQWNREMFGYDVGLEHFDGWLQHFQGWAIGHPIALDIWQQSLHRMIQASQMRFAWLGMTASFDWDQWDTESEAGPCRAHMALWRHYAGTLDHIVGRRRAAVRRATAA